VRVAGSLRWVRCPRASKYTLIVRVTSLPLGGLGRPAALARCRLDGDERRALAVQAAVVGVAGGLVYAGRAAVLGLDRLHGEAVPLHAAVAAALADRLVDDDPFGPRRERAPLARASAAQCWSKMLTVTPGTSRSICCASSRRSRCRRRVWMCRSSGRPSVELRETVFDGFARDLARRWQPLLTVPCACCRGMKATSEVF